MRLLISINLAEHRTKLTAQDAPRTDQYPIVALKSVKQADQFRSSGHNWIHKNKKFLPPLNKIVSFFFSLKDIKIDINNKNLIRAKGKNKKGCPFPPTVCAM